MTKAEAEAFVISEMRLLDEGRLEEWLRLFTADGVYWLPRNPALERLRANAIIYDDTQQREIRVAQLQLEHLAQAPPSRTVHVSGNFEIEAPSTVELTVRCNTAIYEMRPGGMHGIEVGRGVVRVLPAHFMYRLTWSGEWKIAEKRITLLARDEPTYNLSFIM